MPQQWSKLNLVKCDYNLNTTFNNFLQFLNLTEEPSHVVVTRQQKSV